MKVLAVVHSIYNTSPGQRYRIEQWETILKDFGVEIDYAPFETAELNDHLYKKGRTFQKSRIVIGSVINRLRTLLDTRKYDLVYVFREASLIGPAFFEKIIKRQNVPIVYDFDDAIFLPNVSAANAKFRFLKFPNKTAVICRLATHVTVGNNFLAEYARQFNHNVSIIPSTIDTTKYVPRADYKIISSPTIVWSGSITTIQHLQTLSPALQKLAKREKFKLRVIGAADFHLDGVGVENIRWNSETESADLRQGDIGIMPLPNDLWSKGKCGMKALQYMGTAIPTICSNVGANTEIIRDGENGFLAANEEEWLEKLTKLLHSAELRCRIGKAARKTVEQEYSAEVQVPRVYEVFEKAVNTQKHRNG
ncbi:MAG: glycosyltransferase family 4 protein [Pyrinomonadaceae bacterium]